MVVKGIVDEDCSNYKKCSMFIIFPKCSLKCDHENGNNLCQNSSLLSEPDIEISPDTICKRYLQNPLTHAIVLGGLEPFDSDGDVLALVLVLRETYKCQDDVVIYSGYTETELLCNPVYRALQKFPNIIVKFGRFRPDEEPHHDDMLGVDLVNAEQYAKVIGEYHG